MRCLRRNKRELYVCERYQDGNIVKYKQPKLVFINYQVTNSDGDLIALGLEYPMYIRIKSDIEDAKKFHPKDRVYIQKNFNYPFDSLCKDADYEVDSDPIISLNSAEITLKKLSGKE